jgi:hypothetical protein
MSSASVTQRKNASKTSRKKEAPPPVTLTAADRKETAELARELGWTGPVADGLSKRWWVYDDCCGLVCAMITMGLHVFAYWAQWTFIFKPWLGLFGVAHFIYTVLALLAVVSHTRCQFTAPGCVPNSLRPPQPPDLDTEEDKKYYEMLRTRLTHHRTRSIKPRTSHYCHEVDCVVIKMDHYCPWVNNVVALFTQKYFLLFIFYTCLTCIFCGITLGARFATCYSGGPNRKYQNWHKMSQMPAHCQPTTTDTVVSVLNAVEAVIFGIFTIAMGCDQADAVAENTNYIDRLQKKKGKEQTYMQSLEDIFGEKIGWRWLMPFAPTRQLKRDFQKYCKETWSRLAVFDEKQQMAFLEDCS